MGRPSVCLSVYLPAGLRSRRLDVGLPFCPFLPSSSFSSFLPSFHSSFAVLGPFHGEKVPLLSSHFLRNRQTRAFLVCSLGFFSSKSLTGNLWRAQRKSWRHLRHACSMACVSEVPLVGVHHELASDQFVHFANLACRTGFLSERPTKVNIRTCSLSDFALSVGCLPDTESYRLLKIRRSCFGTVTHRLQVRSRVSNMNDRGSCMYYKPPGVLRSASGKRRPLKISKCCSYTLPSP